MEELQPHDIEDLMQELEGEDSTQASPPPDVEELLHVLQSGSRHVDRADAAEQLGEVGRSSSRIVRALIAAYESDSSSMVNRAAAKSVRSPVHQAYLQEHPDLMEAAERALQQRPGADRQRPPSDTSSRPTDLDVSLKGIGEVDSFLSGVFHDRRWRWAPIYGLFLFVATLLVFAVDGLWTLLAAGVVWFAGGVLGLVILGRKGYSVGGAAFSLLDFGDDTPGCLLILLALFALVGPAIMLVALLIRPRGSTVGISKRTAKAKATGRKDSSPVGAGDRGSDCPACGAWNASGSEYCGECGAAVESADA